MKTDFTVLIADRNPHVRCFLKRELAAEGFQVIVAESGQEILKWSFGPLPLDLVVIDPDLPDMDSAALLKKLSGRIPPLPVVLHTLPGEEKIDDMRGMIVFVEKGSQSVDRLKAVIADILSRKKAAPIPDR
ncbi:MAG: response regulator [Pseudomonadota bacterium]